MEQLAVAEDHEAWIARSRVNLTPIAAPSIMGLFGFFIATLMVGAWQAGWYGPATATSVLWPFALFVGGVLQSIAAVVAFRARDGVAVAVHTVWGAFWIGWGLMQGLVAAGIMAAIPIGASSPAFSFWFIGLTCVTGIAFLASGRNLMIATVLGLLTVGSGFTAAGFWAGVTWLDNVGGWLFVASAVAALVAAGSMMLEHAYGRTIIPLGHLSKDATIPCRQPTDQIAYPAGPVGLKVGQ
jgi:uncharacterized protein